MIEELKNQLKSLATDNILKYNQRLIPNTLPVYGVKIPLLRGLAKKVNQGDFRLFLKECDGSSFELQMLEGYVIASAKMPLEERLTYLKAFVPKIQDWAVCDGLVSSLKTTKQYKDEMLNFIALFKDSKNEFEVRFVAVMLMCYYLEDTYVTTAYAWIQELYTKEYYAKMGIAWFIATLMIQYPDLAKAYLADSKHDPFIISKSISKIRESYRIPQQIKDEVLFYKK